MRRSLPALVAVTLALAPLPALSEPVVRAVTLSTAGLALVEAEGTLGADPLRLTLPRTQIDDLLKSLRIADPAGAVARVTLPGPGAFEDAFAVLPFTPEAVADRALLLAAMAGAPVTLLQTGERIEGRILGVSERACEVGICPMLSLLDASGASREFWVDAGLQVEFTDDDDRAALDSALAALRAGSAPRRLAVEIATDDLAERTATLAWLQAAPAWRTAWRAVEGPEGLQLTGWAVVENATGRNWEDVQLTLATGAVRAIAPDLYARHQPWREPDMPPAFARTQSAPGVEAMAADAVPVPVEAFDSESVTRFTLTDPVTLAAGEMLSLPFLSESLPDARLRLHRGGSGARHPLIALEIENPLPLRLPAGVMTFYQEGIGHAGDALIPELAPGARVAVDFARDTAIELQETMARDEVVREMRLVRGVLELAEDLVRETRYRITGAPGADRVLTLDHPRRDDWALDNPNDVEARHDAWRWRIDLPAGAEVIHTVRERQPRLRRLAVADMDLTTLAEWEALSPDPALRERLGAIAGLRREAAEAEAARARAEAEIAALEREQGRLVELIVQIGDEGEATRTRRARVDALDAEIAAAEDARRDLSARIDALRREVADLLAE